VVSQCVEHVVIGDTVLAGARLDVHPVRLRIGPDMKLLLPVKGVEDRIERSVIGSPRFRVGRWVAGSSRACRRRAGSGLGGVES
jgi:hypothetical protein